MVNRLSRMSLIMNHAMPRFSLVHHHLLIYDHTGPAWKLFFKMQNTLENPDLHALRQPGHNYHWSCHFFFHTIHVWIFQRCDGFSECQDNTDELGCHVTDCPWPGCIPAESDVTNCTLREEGKSGIVTIHLFQISRYLSSNITLCIFLLTNSQNVQLNCFDTRML